MDVPINISQKIKNSKKLLIDLEYENERENEKKKHLSMWQLCVKAAVLNNISKKNMLANTEDIFISQEIIKMNDVEIHKLWKKLGEEKKQIGITDDLAQELFWSLFGISQKNYSKWLKNGISFQCTEAIKCLLLVPDFNEQIYVQKYFLSEYIIAQMLNIKKTLNRNENIQIFFLDTDNYISGLYKFMNMEISCYLLAFSLPRNLSKFDKILNHANIKRLFFIPNYTIGREATDISMTASIGELNYLLDKSIPFSIITRDNFVVELITKLAHQRPITWINPDKYNDITFEQGFDDGNFIGTRINNQSIMNKFDVLVEKYGDNNDMETKIKKIRNMLENSEYAITIFEIANLFPLNITQKNKYISWKNILMRGGVLKYLGAKLLNNCSDNLSLKRKNNLNDTDVNIQFDELFKKVEISNIERKIEKLRVFLKKEQRNIIPFSEIGRGLPLTIEEKEKYINWKNILMSEGALDSLNAKLITNNDGVMYLHKEHARFTETPI